MKETGKRIVSKGAYVTTISAKTGLILLAVGLVGFGGLFLYVTYGIISLLPHIDGSAWVGILIILITGGGAAWLLFWSARQVVADAKRIETGVHLTRANTADLSAPDSLVRASEEPVQDPQAVLLRAATNSEQTPAEQLVRPATRTE